MELENFQENVIVSNFLANLCVFFLTSSYCSLFPITVLLSHYRSHVFLASDLLLQVFLYAVLSSTHIDLDAFRDTHCCKVVWCSTPMADFPVSPLELYPELSPVPLCS